MSLPKDELAEGSLPKSSAILSLSKDELAEGLCHPELAEGCRRMPKDAQGRQMRK